MTDGTADIFQSPGWYELGINWSARLAREIPVLRSVFGPPDDLGLLDGACGPGRQLAAMVEAGYTVTGLDCSAPMLEAARRHVAEHGLHAAFVEARLEEMPASIGPLDGIYCLGNSLAVVGSAEAVKRALAASASVLRAGGRVFFQVLNFAKLRQEKPCVRGPRVRHHGGLEYVSHRLYTFYNDIVEVTNVTVWADQGWKHHARSASLYALSRADVLEWLADAGLELDACWGSYNREPYNEAESDDLIVMATKRA